jgi:hypothetical protein
LLLFYNMVAWPIRAMRRSVYYSVGPYQGAWVEAWNGILGLAVIFALVWFGYHHLPEVRSLIDHLSQWWDATVSVQLEQLHFGEWQASDDTQKTINHLPLL